MNIYLAIIIVLLLASYLSDLVVDLLNQKAFSNEVPKEFENIYSKQEHNKAKQYLLQNDRLSFLKGFLSTALLITFILTGIFRTIDNFAESFNLGLIGTALIFSGIIGLIQAIIAIPFSVYDTFIIEAQYGFNRTTVKTFISDLIKAAVLGAIIGALLLTIIILFFDKFGPSVWIYAWAVVVLFELLLAFVAPVVIMPLFNKFTPIDNQELKKAIERYFQSQNFQIQGVYKMDGSKRSTKANAFFTGFGRFRKLVLFDTLIEKHSIEELVAILAHEVGHFKKKHIPKSIVVSLVTSAFMFFVISRLVFSEPLATAFGLDKAKIYTNLIFISILFGPIFKYIGVVSKMLSRRFEFQADHFAATTYGNPNALIDGLKKLSVDHLSNLTPHPVKVFFDYTHPPVLSRIERLRSIGSAPDTRPNP